MDNKQLGDWIKAERASGYTDEQLKDYLLQHGYDKAAVESAFPKESQMPLGTRCGFQLGRYLDSIKGIVLVFFVISIMFTSYATGNVFLGLALLAGVAIAAFVSSMLYKRGKVAIARWSGALLAVGIAVVLVLINLEGGIVFVSLMVTGMIHSIIYHKKSKKALPFESVFLTFLLSAGLSAGINLIGSLILAFGILPLLGEVTTFPLILMCALLGAIGTASYLAISIWLLKRLPNGFDYNAYFRSRSFPFTISNLLSPKEEDVKKAMIGATAAFYLAAVIFCMAGISTVQMKMIFDESANLGHRAYWIFESTYSPEIIISYMGFNVTDTGDIYPQRKIFSHFDEEGIKTMFYGCDKEINCLQKEYISGAGLDEQGVDLEGVSMFIVAQNSSEKVIFLIPELTPEERGKLGLFIGMDDELKTAPFAVELNEEYIEMKKDLWIWRNQLLSRANRYFWNNKERTYIFLSIPFTDRWFDEYLESLHNDLVYITKTGYMVTRGRTVSAQYLNARDGLALGNGFYDGTLTAEEHIASLQRNIDLLYPRWLEAKNQDVYWGENSPPGLFGDESDMALYQIVYQRINMHYAPIKDMIRVLTETSAELDEIRSDREWIIGLYEGRNVEESDVIKITRLALIEKRIANDLFNTCKDAECMREIEELVKYPGMCVKVCTSNRAILPVEELNKCKSECYAQ